MSCAVLAVGTAGAAGVSSGVSWAHPSLFFAGSIVIAITGLSAATLLIAVADRREVAEAGLLGSALLSLTVMLFVRGLVTPDVLMTDNAAVRATLTLAMAVGLVSVAPVALAHTRFGGWVARHWRDAVLLTITAVFLLAAFVVFFPDTIVSPGPRHPLTVAVSVAFALTFGRISYRHARLFDLGGRTSSLVASASLLTVAALAAIPVSASGESPLVWWASALTALGIVGGCASLAVVSRVTRSSGVVLGPIVARDPFAALELGLHPVVQGFISDLGRHDPDAADHVVRTSDLALRIGERMRLSGPELRDVGLAAMLHDIGKVCVPDSVLDKPGELSAVERQLVHQHTVVGERMLSTEPGLETVAAIVRSHHERFDGTGYPDGLFGREIPRAARIIAVCDAIDAMTHDRAHRSAMSNGSALMVLRDHAGTQWDPAVVDHVVALLPDLAAIDGSHVTDPSTQVPVDISDLLASVDAEI